MRHRPTSPIPTAALAVLLALAAGAPPAAAAEPRLIGSFRDWDAYRVEEETGPVCFMSSMPKKQEGDFSRRGDVFALVTHRPSDRSWNVVSFVAGYSYAADTEVSVKVGSQEFRLFTDGDTAWTRDDGADRSLVQAIRQAASMVVRGTSSRGTRTVDTYSLAGSSAAFQAISQACGAERG
ncbi:MAG TPA: invasion associated locus B family protein [Azospirillaceae bacterium]|nr:invasion associated locus B family protein [Azospirillaceae bacterium]